MSNNEVIVGWICRCCFHFCLESIESVMNRYRISHLKIMIGG